MKKRHLWLIGLAGVALIILTLLVAPGSSQYLSGSTYSRDPDGYGAWYRYVQQQGIQLQRWQKAGLPPAETPSTLLQINPSPTPLGQEDWREKQLTPAQRKWIEAGNTLIMLGLKSPATDANFQTMQSSPAGQVKIETSRRYRYGAEVKSRLGDRFGTIVWSQSLGKGNIILAVPTYLAANAYQDEPGNFAFLAKLLTEEGKNRSLWVNEYVHGYRDTKPKASAAQNQNPQIDLSWINYLAKTPILIVFLQAVVVWLILLWGKNRRFGNPKTIPAPVVDNSEAYLQALAEVLQKAESQSFVVESIGKAEQIELQKALGLGPVPVPTAVLIEAWKTQTKRPVSELLPALRTAEQIRTEGQLKAWLNQWQIVRQAFLS